MKKLVLRNVGADEIACFHRDGVVQLKNILSLQAVNRLRRTIDRAVCHSGESSTAYNLTAIADTIENGAVASLDAMSDGQHNIMALAQTIEQSGRNLLRDQRNDALKNGSYFLESAVAEKSRDFRALALNTALGEIAGSLIKSSTVRFHDDQVFVKEPGCIDHTAFHQDSSYFEFEGEQACVMWICVDPANEETGALSYVRGSHRQTRRFKPNTFISMSGFPGSEGDDLPDNAEIESWPETIQYQSEPGDIVVHHYKTLHGATGNRSRYQVRRAASFRYFGDDARYTPKSYVPQRHWHTHDLKEGDPMHAACFPLVWEKAAQDEAA
ncbi:MAG: phytanoyl-CoA dioxygenase family protein [Pseudomonadota bacterium]